MFGRRASVLLPTSARIRRLAPRLLVSVVLLGLWVMHGMSATMESGCHGMPMLMPTTASMVEAQPMAAADAGSSAIRPPTDGAASVHLASNQTGEGELCLSGQPPTLGAWLLALLATLVAVGYVVFTAQVRRPDLRRTRWWWWRGRPHLAGMELLTAVCVSRT